MLSSRMYTSDKLLNVKEVEVTKKYKKFSIIRFITLLGAPKSFIEENNLPIYELRKPTKKKKKIMKKERIEYLVDNFVDANGDERHFVVAAVSEMFDGESDPAYVTDLDGFDMQDVVKGLKLGFAICNPTDKFDEKLGITIAVGRARKNAEYALLASEPGYINTKLVRAFLEQEAEYFKHNPEYKIAGYKRK